MKAMVSLIFSLCFIGLMTGCQMAQSLENDTEKTNILNPENQPNTTDPELREELGYVRYTADNINQNTEDNRQINNREQIADMITITILRSGHFLEVASLVTDKEIVIAYKQHPHSEIDETLAATLAADIASKTAISSLQKSYQIYATENPQHMDVIHQLHLSPMGDADNNQAIERIISEIYANK